MNVHVSMCRCTGLPGTDEQPVDQERSPNGQFLFVTIFHLVRPRRRQEVHELLRVCREEEWFLDGSDLWDCLNIIGTSNCNGSSQFSSLS